MSEGSIPAIDSRSKRSLSGFNIYFHFGLLSATNFFLSMVFLGTVSSTFIVMRAGFFK